MEKVAREKITYTKRNWRETAGVFFVAKNDFYKNDFGFQPLDEEDDRDQRSRSRAFWMNRHLVMIIGFRSCGFDLIRDPSIANDPDRYNSRSDGGS